MFLPDTERSPRKRAAKRKLRRVYIRLNIARPSSPYPPPPRNTALRSKKRTHSSCVQKYTSSTHHKSRLALNTVRKLSRTRVSACPLYTIRYGSIIIVCIPLVIIYAHTREQTESLVRVCATLLVYASQRWWLYFVCQTTAAANFNVLVSLFRPELSTTVFFYFFLSFFFSGG